MPTATDIRNEFSVRGGDRTHPGRILPLLEAHAKRVGIRALMAAVRSNLS